MWYGKRHWHLHSSCNFFVSRNHSNPQTGIQSDGPYFYFLFQHSYGRHIYSRILGLNVFVKSSGFLGYLVLSFMALSSLAIKQPFTLQVAKRDYPEIYWKDPSFLAINNLITIVWAAIFVSNAAIFLLLARPFTIALSNILTASGIIFSIVFPFEGTCLFRYKGIQEI